MKKINFEVTENYRGPKGTSIVAVTAVSEAACGYPFQEGESYLVFAGGDDSHLVVSLCSATKLTKYAQEDITYLRSIDSLPARARVYGSLKRYTFDPSFVPKFEPSIMDHRRPPEETYRAMSPLSGTVVRIETQEGERETIVSESGIWEFADLPPGPYELHPVLARNLVLLPAFGIRDTLEPKGCAAVALRAQSNGHLIGHITSDVPLSKYYLAQVGVFRAEEKEIDLIRPFAEKFPDRESGNYDLGPLPPGKYFLAVILTNDNLDEAATFAPGTDVLGKARKIELGDGETISGLDFTITKPKFKERPTCCAFKIRVPQSLN
ncbi:MAG: hypothetical protein JSS69_06375 [Acidobacteria bacterium]|nr:hypothetical protein [Acidobacteriota bacterium]MBS1865529.1 hypothetical protein [Acidobacteriota bacterium]